jgi:hypothetical protein
MTRNNIRGACLRSAAATIPQKAIVGPTGRQSWHWPCCLWNVRWFFDRRGVSTLRAGTRELLRQICEATVAWVVSGG